MQESFFELIDMLCGILRGEEVLLANISCEESDFVRFNHSAVRQAGTVHQRYLKLGLIVGQRHLSATTTLCGNRRTDHLRAQTTLALLRDRLSHVPEDPYLLYATEPRNSEHLSTNRLRRCDDVLEEIFRTGQGRDMVGLYAGGGIYRGFANSLGQRNWFETYTFHLDWCFYHETDKAVKTTYAGFEWNDADFSRKVDSADKQLAILSRPAKTLHPGGYRVYLAPEALNEFVGLILGGFGLKQQRTRTTSLLKMTEGGATLSPAVTIRENTRKGTSPNFQSEGFIKPDEVPLIGAGSYGGCLISPRSAKEYEVPTNGASAGEGPQSLDMSGGTLPRDEALKRLGKGVWIDRLWYLNYSDRPACRITGMTRFATFWVEGGRIQAPLNVMRFDETAYRVLGEKLIDLTAERDFIPGSSTHGGRSMKSARVPGALVDDFTFTL